MNKIFNKLRSRAGESLIESLAAILVVTMASIVEKEKAADMEGLPGSAECS